MWPGRSSLQTGVQSIKLEETFMKNAKSRGGSGSSGAGLNGLQTNYGAYQRWTRSTSEQAKDVQATYKLANMVDQYAGTQHRDVRSTEIQRRERQVMRTVEAIRNFSNPFTMPDKDIVLCIFRSPGISSC